MGALFDGLITWSIRHRAVVLLVALGLMVAGLATMSRASLDVLPDFMPLTSVDILSLVIVSGLYLLHMLNSGLSIFFLSARATAPLKTTRAAMQTNRTNDMRELLSGE